MTALNPGIARTVAWLNANGFRTTDSGDGKTRGDYAYVVIVLEKDLIAETTRLVELLRARGIEFDDTTPVGPMVQGTFAPGSVAPYTIDVSNIDDALMGLP